MSVTEFQALPGWEQRAWLGYFRLLDDDSKERARQQRKAQRNPRPKRRAGRRRK